MTTTTPSVDYAARAQKAAEDRLAAASEILDFEGESQLSDEDAKSYEQAYQQMAGPYCGCETCIVREVLDAAWPILEEAALAERLEKLDLRSGDAVILRPHYKLDADDAQRISVALKAILPEGVKGIIIASDMDINVIPAAASKHEYECKCLVSGNREEHGTCQVCGRSANEHHSDG